MIRHMKRVVSPVFWRAGRRNHVWITSPNPGPHPVRASIPLQVLLRDVLHLVKTGREARAAVREGHVIVDGVARKDHKFPVGFMDVIQLPMIKKQYRVIPYEKGLKVIEVSAKEAKIKLVKIVSKQIIRGGKIQVTSHDGRNYLDIGAEVGDTLVLKNGKLEKTLGMKKGALCIVFKGRQAGRMGKLLKQDPSANQGLVRLEGNKKVFEAPASYVMVVGDDKPLVKLYEENND